MIVGCYTLDLYCDFCKPDRPHADGRRDQFIGRTETDCFKEAKKFGWRISRQRMVRCPKCVKGKK